MGVGQRNRANKEGRKGTEQCTMLQGKELSGGPGQPHEQRQPSACAPVAYARNDSTEKALKPLVVGQSMAEKVSGRARSCMGRDSAMDSALRWAVQWQRMNGWGQGSSTWAERRVHAAQYVMCLKSANPAHFRNCAKSVPPAPPPRAG